MGEVHDHPCSTSRAASLRPTGQRGSILMLVLAVVMMLSVVSIVVLRMSTTTNTVSHRLEADTRSIHRIDGAMEEAVNQVRDDDQLCVAATPEPQALFSSGSYQVQCTLPNPATGERVMEFVAEEQGSSTVVGRGRVKVVDQVNGVASVGYSIEVCDWLLGKVTLEADLKGCSA